MPMRTRGSDGAGPSLGVEDIPNPPPGPPSLADAIAILLSATIGNAHLLRELAQRQLHHPPNFRAQNNPEGETRYVDFTEMRPPVFTKADEPLEANDWLRTMEHKFSLIHCSETKKPLFAAQQLRGAVGAWWENFLAIQTPRHQVTWTEFKDTFHAHYIPEGLMAMKAEEFLALRQGDKSVMEYVAKFNHLSQYATKHVNTDRKKKACFMRGLNTKLQTMMTTCQNATYYEAVNIAIASEEKNRKHKEAKKKATSSPFSGHSQKCQRIIYHPQSHRRFLVQPPFRGSFPPLQYRPGQ